MYGIAMPGSECESYDYDVKVSYSDKNEYDGSGMVFENNVAHSVNGQGVTVYPVPGNARHAECYEASGVLAYKNAEGGFYAYYVTNQLVLRDSILIDNGYSVIG
mmetsp:Transcript_22262/g.16724  ORF Transcript_22262/g.16724 Transcript_22262/m.16724 type:complete len:104 (-) Transcript_22262:609-920(-)